MLLQLLFVLVAIIIGARLGGIGLGVLGGLGLAVLTFVFGLEPTSPPIDVMLMIVAVIAAASCMQAAGGLDLMVKWAEKLLRKNPSKITLLSPLVTYIFTFIAGTGHVAYSVLPVIAEVATETKIRPERPLGIAVIASQQAITASPISAATVALLSMQSGYHISLMDILMISVPCTLIGVLAGAFCSLHVGKELAEDPEYLRRIANGEFTSDQYRTKRRREPSCRPPVSRHIHSGDNRYRPVRLDDRASSLVQPARWQFPADADGAYHRDPDALGCRPYPARHPDGRHKGRTRLRLLRRHASSRRNFRYCLDGRHLHRREHGGTERLDRTYRNGNALAFRPGPVRDVHPTVQPGGNHPGDVAVRNRPRHLSLHADRPFPRSQRLFLHSQLSDRSRCHQLRPYRDDAYRQICPEPFIHDARTGRHRSVGGIGAVDDPVVLK